MSLHDLCARIDDHLHEFEAIDLGEERSWDSSGTRHYPSLYISGKKEAALLKMPRDGKAVVGFRVRRRNIDETHADGEPRYGADIEITDIEPLPEAEEEVEMHAVDAEFLKEFGSMSGNRLYRVEQAMLKKLRKSGRYMTRDINETMRKSGVWPKQQAVLEGSINRGMARLRAGKPGGNPKGGMLKDAGRSPSRLQELEARIVGHLHEFAGERDRDSAGRFSAGSVPSPDDYAIAEAARKKKKMAIGGGVAGVAALGGLAATGGGRKAVSGVGSGLARVASRVMR